MGTEQGALELLSHPIAQELLTSAVWARLAYTWDDGTPRLVPIGFYWNGRELVLGTGTDAPKMRALRDGAKVALTIERETPSQVLTIRGSVRIATGDGIVPEYAAMARRMMGEAEGQAWVEMLGAGLPQMARIAITPEWVGLLDFETRFPHWVEQALARGQAAR